ncbi:type VI secretion system domain-containing protein [Escherichia coli]|uniref:type VI secretion system domain-containing protein n=2 Tax=Escherichia coli TaxID=562 RepID=UPI00164F107A|nr:type VI secretion system domain-containing protein [Escherichia coli]HAY4717941.1 hypothetical protein [Escherichia coli]HDK0357146.1 type VI secretion system domain-containing protein [Escherichia coli]
MIQIDLPTLVKRLNLFSRQALEMAASECMSQQAAEITVSHVLIQMLAMPRSDLRVITRQGDIGMEELRQALTVENYTTARSADSYPAFSPMLVEWLKEGWLLASAEMQHSELRGGVLLLALLHSPLRYIPPAAARLLTGINRDRLQQDFVQWTQESAESVVPDADGKGAGTMTDASDTLLARYAKNMTADARNGRLDPVLCRDHEIDLMIDILCRRRKNNPVVVGEAGVGKSALIEGLALRIVAGQVPDKLKNTDIMTLDLGALQAGASVKGEFEKRFKGLMPQLTGLLFNDHTPFISEQTKQWLAASPDAKVAPVAQIGEESKAARACFAEQGLEAALRYLDMLPEGDPRDQFHRQYLAAQLTEEAGLVQLAQQQYRMLFRMGLQMMVADWEPSLLEQLEQKFTAEQ